MRKSQGMKGWVGAWSMVYQRMRVIQCLYHLSLPGFHQELQNEEGWCLRRDDAYGGANGPAASCSRSRGRITIKQLKKDRGA